MSPLTLSRIWNLRLEHIMGCRGGTFWDYTGFIMRHLREEPKVGKGGILEIWAKFEPISRLSGRRNQRNGWVLNGVRVPVYCWGWEHRDIGCGAWGSLDQLCVCVCLCLYIWGDSSTSGTSTWQTECLIYLVHCYMYFHSGFHPAQQDRALVLWLCEWSACLTVICVASHASCVIYVVFTCAVCACTSALLGHGNMELQQSLLTWIFSGSHIMYFLQEISSLFIYTYIPNQKVQFGSIRYVVKCRLKNFYFGERKSISQTNFLFFCPRKSLGVLVPLIFFISLLNLCFKAGSGNYTCCL